MVIYPLAKGFSYDPESANYKGPGWMVKNIIDTAAKGGSFQVRVGPDATGRFHPTAVAQLKQAGGWLRTCGAVFMRPARRETLARRGIHPFYANQG